MITRVRIEAEGGSASEVEAQLTKFAAALDEMMGWLASDGEQVIERQLVEPSGHTAHKGRLILHPNVASDSGQVAWFTASGVKLTKPYWAEDEARTVGGVPTS